MMLNQYLQIGKVWLQRPLNWILILTLAVTLLASTGKKTTRLEKVSSSPKPSFADDIISTSEVLLDKIELGETNESVTGLDFYRMGSITRNGNVLVPFSEISDSLILFPNLQWIHFAQGQLQQLRPGELAELRNLKSVEVAESLLTQADLERLAEVRPLSWLVIDSPGLEGTLAPLAKLPALRRLELRYGSRRGTTDSKRNLFRHEVVQSMGDLKHLESVVLDDQWHAISDLQKNVQTSLLQLPDLKELWFGSQRTLPERELLTELAASLPGVSVHPSHYDVAKIDAMIGATVVGFILMFTAGAMLYSHFSTPQAKLIPGYAKPHRRAFYLVLIFASAIGVYSITSNTLIAIVPCISAVCFIAALATLCLLQFGVLSPQNLNTLTWLPFLVFACVYGLMIFRESYPWIGCVIDQYLLGVYPVAVIFMMTTSIVCVVWSVRQFDDQHRWFAENSLPSLVAVEDLSLYQAARYSRQHGMKAFERKAERWEPKFDAIVRRTVNGEQLAKVMRWGYGSAAYDVVSRFGVFGLLITIAAIAILLYQNSTTESIHAVGVSMVGYMIAAAAVIPVITINHDRSINSMELLRPISRKDFIRVKFTLAFLQVAGCLAFTLVYGSLLSAVAHGAPSLSELFRRAVMLAVTGVFVTSFATIFCLIRNVFLAAFLLLLELTLVGTVAAAFVDDSLGGRLDAFGPSITMFRWQCLAIATMLAFALLLCSRRLWFRMEFGKV